MTAFHNLTPAIPGFYPDPTMCATPMGVYLANSSFELFPGAPVFHSRDMATWQQVGNVIDRPGQVELSRFTASAGIYGSTIRHHDDRFWFITTAVGQFQGQLLFTADDAAGPWSHPVQIEAPGIDPDIAWDASGTCYLTWCHAQGGISQVTIDPETGRLLSERRELWSGTGMKFPEGPHLYEVDGWWYLLIAEGGTERGHCSSVARSRRPDGDFEGCPNNPILTHRSTNHPVQSVGHADLAFWNGRWWACYHGTRARGWTPEFHVLGRETMVCPVDWVDGWPVFREDLAATHQRDTTVTIPDTSGLSPLWVRPGGDLSDVAMPHGSIELHGPGRPLGFRVRDLNWICEAVLDVSEGTGSLLVYLDDEHFFAVEADPHSVRAVGRSTPFHQVFDELDVRDPSAVRLTIAAALHPGAATPNGPDLIALRADGTTLAELDGRHLSTEVAGGFTGRLIAVQAHAGTVRCTALTYQPT